MRKPMAVGLAFVLWVGVGSNAIGQESKPKVSQETKDKWQSLTPEQKEAAKERAKKRSEARQKLTPEQKEAMKKKWDSLTQEEKDALKAKARERQTK
jgi:TRAP-type C4-dicarboxylate transport system substrate-binding protein